MAEKLFVKFIVSEDIETQSNGMQQRQVLINPLINLRTKYIPTSLSLGVTIILAGLKPTSDYVFDVVIRHKQSNQSIFATGPTPGVVPPDADNFLININLKNVDIENEGEYEISINVAGDTYSDSFFILKRI